MFEAWSGPEGEKAPDERDYRGESREGAISAALAAQAAGRWSIAVDRDDSNRVMFRGGPAPRGLVSAARLRRRRVLGLRIPGASAGADLPVGQWVPASVVAVRRNSDGSHDLRLEHREGGE